MNDVKLELIEEYVLGMRKKDKYHIKVLFNFDSYGRIEAIIPVNSTIYSKMIELKTAFIYYGKNLIHKTTFFGVNINNYNNINLVLSVYLGTVDLRLTREYIETYVDDKIINLIPVKNDLETLVLPEDIANKFMNLLLIIVDNINPFTDLDTDSDYDDSILQKWSINFGRK